jgi:hypothetical protein
MATSTHGSRSTTFQYNETTTAPTASDDGTADYSIGSRWWDTTADKEYVCLDTTTSNAVWLEIHPDGNYAGVSVNGNTNATAVGVISTWYQFTEFDTNDPASGSTPDHTNDHITISESGDYVVIASVSFSTGAANAQTYQWQVQVNNGAAAKANLTLERKLNAGGDVGSAGVSGIVTLAANDTVELWVQNTGGTDDPIGEFVTLSVFKVPRVGSGIVTTQTKSITIEVPTSSEDICIFRAPQAITITEVIGVVVGTGSPSVTCLLEKGTDRSASRTAITSVTGVTSTTTGTPLTITSGSVAAGSWVSFVSSNVGGDEDEVHISIKYTID